MCSLIVGRPIRIHPAAAAILCLTACGPARDTPPPGALVTRIDSTGDTIRTRVEGDLTVAQEHSVVPIRIIAAEHGDTNALATVYEFVMDRAGPAWIFDEVSGSIFLYDSAGTLLRRIGRRGSGPGEFQQNGGMAVLPGDKIAVWDPANTRITILDSAGTPERFWPTAGGFGMHRGLIANRAGDLYLIRPVAPPRPGEQMFRLGLIRVLAGGAIGDTVVPPDMHVPRAVYAAQRKGERSVTWSEFAPDEYWAPSPTAGIVSADGGAYRLLATGVRGRPISIRRNMAPVPINAAERSYETRRIEWEMRRTDAGWTWQGAPVPGTKAPVQGLQVASDGRIWVRVAVPSEPIPADERETPADSLRPVPRYRMPPV